MSEPIIQARDLGIRFDKGRQKQGSIKSLFVRRETNKPKHVEEFWPLRNLNFDIYPGDSVGVIGSNGTGKSTLLRLITGVLLPDEGYVRRRGNVAPLIALSAGFSGDLTGRENVQLVGALHGLTRKEIAEKFDEIVEFAELEDFIDTPVRHYSSGMKVRLGFAVITQLPHPILLVDEALAVGDRRFKRKCHEVIDRLLKEGRTLVFVSHAASDLKRYCKRGLFMDAGRLIVDGTVQEALDAYAETDEAKDKAAKAKRRKKAAERKAKADEAAMKKDAEETKKAKSKKDKHKDKKDKKQSINLDDTLVFRSLKRRKGATEDTEDTTEPTGHRPAESEVATPNATVDFHDSSDLTGDIAYSASASLRDQNQPAGSDQAPAAAQNWAEESTETETTDEQTEPPTKVAKSDRAAEKASKKAKALEEESQWVSDLAADLRSEGPLDRRDAFDEPHRAQPEAPHPAGHNPDEPPTAPSARTQPHPREESADHDPGLAFPENQWPRLSTDVHNIIDQVAAPKDTEAEFGAQYPSDPATPPNPDHSPENTPAFTSYFDRPPAAGPAHPGSNHRQEDPTADSGLSLTQEVWEGYWDENQGHPPEILPSTDETAVLDQRKNSEPSTGGHDEDPKPEPAASLFEPASPPKETAEPTTAAEPTQTPPNDRPAAGIPQAGRPHIGRPQLGRPQPGRPPEGTSETDYSETGSPVGSIDYRSTRGEEQP
ncbi:ABC transporter ATP-binding protein [Natronoglycomyces albus]|uniref:ATP-binding cassette domain-containing protein n=1 Tax=Natronoglycomyces albus TaxID=2811108 RepID=A0A895XQG9_9ACTN|nr:ABC transporter ATP-binding protein [Natronoglycomyces albus]QSB05783.1 ATP-binding cassette domain-containing protein [Natronoglycomyces albus]